MIMRVQRFDVSGLRAFALANSAPEENAYAPGARCFYKPPIGEALMHAMLPQMQTVIGKTVYAVSSFIRIHDHGTELHGHYDRRGLEWTVSIPVEMDRGWPIDVLENWEWVPKLARIGEGVLVNGTVYPHRRLPYRGKRATILTLSYSSDPAYANDAKLPAAAPPYLRMEGLLSADQIERIYREFDATKMQPGMMSKRNIPTTTRTNQLGWLRRPDWQWLYDHVRHRMNLVNSMSWRLDLEGESTDELQLTRYEPGDWYPWHVDCDAGAADQCQWRSLSTSILLRNSDGGGGIELQDGGVIPLDPGDAVIFPATARHRALEVTEGTRDSLVLWLSGRH